MVTGAKRLATLVVAATLTALGCGGGGAAVSGPQAAQLDIQRRIAGVWRVTSYIPDQTLSPALLISMQGESIRVRFDQGRMRSASTGMTFDRAYRIDNVQGNSFSFFVLDESGVEYESRARFDESGSIHFQTVTPPWTGHGVLQREGPAMKQSSL